MKPRSILVIDDEEAIRETLRMAFELEGYQVYTAGNGQEALRMLREVPRPCLIVLDLMMPLMNGWEFSLALAEDVRLATVPIAVLTAFPERAEQVRAKCILKKPIDLSTLFVVAHECCNGAAGAESPGAGPVQTPDG